MTVRLTLVAAARSSPCSRSASTTTGRWTTAGWHEVERAAHALVPLAAAELRYCSPTAAQPGDRRGARLRAAGPARPARLRHGPLARLYPGRGAAREPAAVDVWLADPRSAPHGGESLLAFISRIGGWLDTRPVEEARQCVAVAEPGVVRAALVYALKAPPHSYWNVDVTPLSTVTLTGRAGGGDCGWRRPSDTAPPGRQASPGGAAHHPLRRDPDDDAYDLRRQLQVLLARAGPLILLGQ